MENKCVLREVENELDGVPRRVEISADGSRMSHPLMGNMAVRSD